MKSSKQPKEVGRLHQADTQETDRAGASTQRHRVLPCNSQLSDKKVQSNGEYLDWQKKCLIGIVRDPVKNKAMTEDDWIWAQQLLGEDIVQNARYALVQKIEVSKSPAPGPGKVPDGHNPALDLEGWGDWSLSVEDQSSR